MKKQHINLKQLNFKKNKVALLNTGNLTGGINGSNSRFPSWTGVAGECLSNLDCPTCTTIGGTTDTGTTGGGATGSNPYITDFCGSFSDCPTALDC